MQNKPTESQPYFDQVNKLDLNSILESALDTDEARAKGLYVTGNNETDGTNALDIFCSEKLGSTERRLGSNQVSIVISKGTIPPIFLKASVFQGKNVNLSASNEIATIFLTVKNNENLFETNGSEGAIREFIDRIVSSVRFNIAE